MTTGKEAPMTRRLSVFLVLLLVLMLGGCAGSSKYMAKSEPPIAGPPPDKSVVYVMRPSGFGFAINFQIWDRDRFIGLSQAKSYFAYVCDPGKHLFIGIAENKVAVDADLAPGKSYYIVTEPRMGGWKARLAMTPVTKGSENWDKVEGWKSEMEFITPVAEEVRAWDESKKEEARGLVNFFEKDPDREKYLGRLSPDDGR
jgi:hypothetical protein